MDYVESGGEDYYRYFDRDPVLRYSDQPVVDVAQFVELRLRHWLDCFCRIGVVKHRKPLRRFVWYYEDIPRPFRWGFSS